MIKHAFESTQPDSADPNEVSADEWNADHVIDDADAVKAALAIDTSDVSGLSAALSAKANTADLDDVAFSGSASHLQTGTLPAGRLPALSGEVTSSAGSAATTIANDAVTTAKIANDAVTYAKLQNASATARILARITTGAGDWEEATAAQILSILGLSALVGFGRFGTASDGSVTFDGSTAVAGYSGPVANVYTATRPAYFQNMTVNVGVTVNQHTHKGPYVRGTCLNNGHISWDGANASGQTGGAIPGATGTLPVGTAGGNGGAANTNGSNGTSSSQAPRTHSTTAAAGGVGATPSPGSPTAGGTCHGGGGGAALANGGGGGGITQTSTANGDWESFEVATTGIMTEAGSIVKLTTGTGGGGGAGGGNSVGGGAGAAGCWGVFPVFHYDPASTGTVTSKGGNGANAATASGSNQAGGGGGGGGGGGNILIITADQTPFLTSSDAATACAGGTPGNGVAGTGTGVTGTNGAAGGSGVIRVFN